MKKYYKNGSGNKLYKVFSTLVKDGQLLGESILCENFSSLEDAKEAGEKNMLFPGCFFKVREYDTSNANVIIGGDNDTGKIVFSFLSASEEKKLALLVFRVHPELSKFTDSMLFNSGEDEIAFSKWSYGDETLEITLGISGQVAVTYKDVTYHKPSDFPEELISRIKAHPFDWDVCASKEEGYDASEGDVYVGMNNWYEYVWKSNSFSDGDVYEQDVSKASGNHILEDMEFYAKQFFKVAEDTTVTYPLFSLYGYDKDNDVFALYGMLDDKDAAIEEAKKYKRFLDDGKMLRYCSDGSFEPLDWLEVVSTNDERNWHYKSYIQEYYEKHPVEQHDYSSSRVMPPDYTGMSYNEIQRAMMVDNID